MAIRICAFLSLTHDWTPHVPNHAAAGLGTFQGRNGTALVALLVRGGGDTALAGCIAFKACEDECESKVAGWN